MPVDQRQANTGVVRRNPSAAGRLAWKNCMMAFKFDSLGWQSGKAVWADRNNARVSKAPSRLAKCQESTLQIRAAT